MKILRWSMMFILFFSLYHLTVLYIGWNLNTWLGSMGLQINKLVLFSILLLFAYTFFLSHFFKQIVLLKIIGAYWLAFLQYCILLLPLANIAAFTLTYFIEVKTSIFIVGNITVILFLFIFLIGSYNAYSPIVRNYKLILPKKNGQNSSLKVVMASDMHFGTLSGLSHLQRMVEKINELSADIILFPGDIIDDDPNPFLKKKMGDKLRLIHAPLGIYGVLGNHEYYGKKIPEFLNEMNRIGVRILLDEKLIIDNRFILIGRKDKTDKKRKTIQDLVVEEVNQLPIIMMDHQPAELTEAMNAGIDLTLSGHTHRGQMAPNHFITKKVFELDWGYKQIKQLHAIVSSGYGFWGPPIRMGSRSEIVSIDIDFE